MISEFEYVDLIFENCNYVRILPKYIRNFDLQEITTNIWANIVHQYTEVKNCKRFEIVLDLKALEIKTHFEEEFDCDETFKQHINIFKDITCINIKPNGEKEFCIGVPWESGNDHDTMNILQRTEYEETVFTIICEKI